MEQEYRLELGDATYVMRPCNATAAWHALKDAGSLFKGIALDTHGDGKSTLDIGSLLGNLGDPAMERIEKIVYEHTTVSKEGKSYRLSDKVDTHFNEHRGDMIPVLIEGIKYQFQGFFSNGVSASLARLFKNLETQ
jgi:hypothetical protein